MCDEELLIGDDFDEALEKLEGDPDDKPNQADVIDFAGAMLTITASANSLPIDFDGCAVSVLREQETGRLTAVIISPVDLHGDEPFPRYQVNPTQVVTAKPKSIVLV